LGCLARQQTPLINWGDGAPFLYLPAGRQATPINLRVGLASSCSGLIIIF